MNITQNNCKQVLSSALCSLPCGWKNEIINAICMSVNASAGSSGYSGYSGFSGAGGDGLSGISGYSGYSGIGFSGISGYSGYSGDSTSGYSGYSGSNPGASGFSGNSGYSGFSGANPGQSGYSGFSGANPGSSGFSGYSGYSGFSGSNPGQSGFSGYSGQPGTSGFSGQATPITADNGLIMSTPTNVQLGAPIAGNAPLLHDTYINPNGFFTRWENVAVIDSTGVVGIGKFSSYQASRLHITDNTLSTNALRIESTAINGAGLGLLIAAGNTSGISALVVNGTGFIGQASGTGTGIVGSSADGFGGTFSSNSSPLKASNNNSTTNAVKRVVEMAAYTTGTAASGLGGSIDFEIETDDGNTLHVSNQLIWKWTDAAVTTRTSQAKLTGILSAVSVDLMTWNSDGSVDFRPITATEASAITPSEGKVVMVSSTNGTFTSIGFWGYRNGAWAAF